MLKLTARQASKLGLKPIVKASGPKKLTKPEREFLAWLEIRNAAGLITWYAFEPFTVTLSSGCRYTPDFAFIDSGGGLQFAECKGPYVRDDSVVKLKWFADKYPFPLWLIKARNVQLIKGNATMLSGVDYSLDLEYL